MSAGEQPTAVAVAISTPKPDLDATLARLERVASLWKILVGGIVALIAAGVWMGTQYSTVLTRLDGLTTAIATERDERMKADEAATRSTEQRVAEWQKWREDTTRQNAVSAAKLDLILARMK